MVNIKVCKSCGVAKEISEFQKRKDSKDGYREENLKKSNKFK